MVCVGCLVVIMLLWININAFWQYADVFLLYTINTIIGVINAVKCHGITGARQVFQ